MRHLLAPTSPGHTEPIFTCRGCSTDFEWSTSPSEVYCVCCAEVYLDPDEALALDDERAPTNVRARETDRAQRDIPAAPTPTGGAA